MLGLDVRPPHGTPYRKSLGHRDAARAIEQAKELQAQFTLNVAPSRHGATVGVVLDAFVARQRERRDAGALTAGAVADAERAAEFWKLALGADRDASELTQDDIERTAEKRKAGLLDARGHAVPKPDARPVRTRASGSDLEVLRAALRWAVHKRRLLKVNVMDGYEIPAEKNPRRAVADADRYEATLKVADAVMMELRGIGKRVKVPCYLPELLTLAYATGRRISAILGLRTTDLRLDPTTDAPYGEIVWSAASDKEQKEWRAAIDEQARKALDRIAADRLVGVRSRWPETPLLFPSPCNPSRPVSKNLASAWLEAAEKLAELPKLDGSLWHCYRRTWATARKHHPLADVAAVGGWKTLRVLSDLYQQADRKATLRVVLEPRELRA
jgi:integrase